MSRLTATEIGVTGRGAPRLDGVDLTVGPGELVAVLGPNGAGKTTLLRALLGLVDHAGQVQVDGRPVTGMTPVERAGSLAWLSQRQPLEEGLTAMEVVAAARYRFNESRAAGLTAAREALVQAAAGDLAEHAMETLSGGEIQRVRLASLIAQEAALWLLDEPGNHLDPALQLALYEALVAQVRGGRGLVLVTHDLLRLPFLDQEGVHVTVLVLQEGREALRARLDDPTLPERLGQVFGLSLFALDVDGQRRFVIGGRR